MKTKWMRIVRIAVAPGNCRENVEIHQGRSFGQNMVYELGYGHPTVVGNSAVGYGIQFLTTAHAGPAWASARSGVKGI